MRLKLLLLLIFIVLIGSSFSVFTVYADEGISQLKLDRIDNYVQREMKEGKIPGLSLGIVYGDETVYLKGYGFGNEKKTPVTPKTPFIIGSISKTFTALAIRQLVNEGKVDYDAPVQKYIPWFSTADPEASAKITIKDLINHTSGLSKAAGNTAYTGYKYSLEQLVRQINKVKPSWPVGSKEEYSNLNYLILGYVVQTVSGKPYEDYIQENIFDFLDMKNSYSSEEKAKENGLAAGHRVVYGMDLATHVPYPKGNLAQGFLISSAEDMAKYLVCYLNNGWFRDKSIIPDNALNPPENPDVSFSQTDKFYQIYWNIVEGGTGYYGHSGATVNYTSTMVMSPYTRYGIVILANSSNSFDESPITPDTICSGVISILQGGDIPTPLKPRASKASIVMLACIFLSMLLLALRTYCIKFFSSKIKESRAKLVRGIVSMLLIDIIVPILIIFVLPAAYGITLIYAISSNPEWAVPLSFVALALLTIGFVKAAKLYLVFKNERNGVEGTHKQ